MFKKPNYNYLLLVNFTLHANHSTESSCKNHVDKPVNIGKVMFNFLIQFDAKIAPRRQINILAVRVRHQKSCFKNLLFL